MRSIRSGCYATALYMLFSVCGCSKGTVATKEAEKATAPAPSPESTSSESTAPSGEESNAGQAEEEAEAEPVPEVVESGLPAPARPDEDYPLIPLSEISEDPDVQALVLQLRNTGNSRTIRRRFEALTTRRAVPVLIRAMRAANTNVRSQAATIINRMDHKSRGYTEALAAALLSDPDPDVRGNIGRVLVYHDRRPIEALEEALEKDESEAVRMHAAWALGASHNRGSWRALVAALKDESTDVRLRAVGALKRVRARRAVPWIVSCLEDSNPMVRDRAREALEALTGKRLGSSLRSWRRRYPAPSD